MFCPLRFQRVTGADSPYFNDLGRGQAFVPAAFARFERRILSIFGKMNGEVAGSIGSPFRVCRMFLRGML